MTAGPTVSVSYDILEHVPLGCLVVRGSGQIVFWNHALERSTGQRRDVMVGKNLFEQFPRLREPRFRMRIEQTLRAGTPSVFSALLTHPMFHSDMCPIERRFEQVTVTRTTPFGVDEHEILFSVTDVTEQHRRGELFRSESRRATAEAAMRCRREEELRVAMEGAEAATRSKSLFLAAMSHELRTPMNGVLGMCDLLLQSNPTSTQREYLEILHASASSLLTVLNDILDFSKIEADKLELETIVYDPRKIVEESICLVAEMAHAKDVECIAVVEPNVPSAVVGDPIRFRQVLMNLLSNAVKFTAAGEILAHLDVRSDGDALVLLCAIRDTGAGMEAETCRKLFEPFVQATRATSRLHGGTGLGLSICRRLVRLMGGDIEVTSEPGRGSEFRFELRVASRPDDQRDQPPGALSEIRVGIALSHPSAARSLATQLASRRIGEVRMLVPADLAVHSRVHDLTHVVVDQPSWVAAASPVPAVAGPRFLFASRVSFALGAHPPGFYGVLSLPCRRSAVDVSFGLGVPEAGPHEPPARPCLKGLRVLVADDNPTNQIVARSMLTKLGCEVRVVDGGGAAVTAARTDAFDIILMDMQMPVVNGLEATAQLRRSEHAGPIVALTASALADDRAACLSAGMDDFLAKPIDRPALVAVLERWGVARNLSPLL